MCDLLFSFFFFFFLPFSFLKASENFTILKVVTSIYQECCLFKIAHEGGSRIHFSHVS